MAVLNKNNISFTLLRYVKMTSYLRHSQCNKFTYKKYKIIRSHSSIMSIILIFRLERKFFLEIYEMSSERKREGEKDRKNILIIYHFFEKRK